MIVRGSDFVQVIGSQGFSEGKFRNPRGIGLGVSGDLFVADTMNHRIQKFDSNGNFVFMMGWGVDTGANEFQICKTSCEAGSGAIVTNFV